MNRVGDMMLSIGLFGLFALSGSLDYSVVFSISPYVNETSITIISLLLFAGATAKSAQIPLHVWLPGSIEGFFYLIFVYFIVILFYLLRSRLAELEVNFVNISKRYLNILTNGAGAVDLQVNYVNPAYAGLYYSYSRIHAKIGIYSFSTFNSRDLLIKKRDSKGRFVSESSKSLEALNKENLEALYGELLGDGHLRFNKKGEDGLPKPNTNAQFAITLKSKEYVYYLWKTIYKDICSNVEPHP